MLVGGTLNWLISHIETGTGTPPDLERQNGGCLSPGVGLSDHCTSVAGYPYGSGEAQQTWMLLKFLCLYS
jgi:hypothetical protein